MLHNPYFWGLVALLFIAGGFLIYTLLVFLTEIDVDIDFAPEDIEKGKEDDA